MVKHIHLRLDDGTYERLVEAKDDQSWEDFLPKLLDIYEGAKISPPRGGEREEMKRKLKRLRSTLMERMEENEKGTEGKA